jgi:hypothetical protein
MRVQAETEMKSSKRGLKLRDLLRQGVTVARKRAKLKKDFDEKDKDLKKELEGIQGKLMRILATYKNRSETDNITFELGGKDARGVEIAWKPEYPVDMSSAMKLKEKLGDQFTKVFSIRPTINRARTFKSWLEKDQGPLNALKTKIEACVETIQKGPNFKWRAEKAQA